MASLSRWGVTESWHEPSGSVKLSVRLKLSQDDSTVPSVNWTEMVAAWSLMA